jgi:hypothetical protein
MRRSTRRNIFVNSAAIRAGVPACIQQSDLPLDDGQLGEIFLPFFLREALQKVASPKHGLTEPWKKGREMSLLRPLATFCISGCNFDLDYGIIQNMTTKDLKTLLDRARSWPEEAQDELVDVANQIESELQNREYLATQEELRIIDAAMNSIDHGEFATEAEVETVFGKFRPA